MRLVGERCSLRPWAAGDLDALVRIADDSRIARWLRDRFPSPYTRADGEAWLRIAADSPPGVHFAVDAGGELAGGVGMCPGDDIERVGAEVGIWLGVDHWGRGIGSEALRLFAAHAFASFPLERLSAKVFATNAASRRTVERAGFVLEGIMRRAFIKAGVVEDACLFALVRAD